MHRITVGKLTLSLAKCMLASFLVPILLANTAWSQTFDSFRFVGVPGTPTGTVTSLTLDPAYNNDASDANTVGELAFFNAAGLSSVFAVTIRASSVISGQTPVYSAADGEIGSGKLTDLHNIAFYTGELTDDSNTAPPSWFRLTHYQGTWSGVFRVGSQIYSLDRERATDVIQVRTTLSDAVQFSPTLRARIDAVFSVDYFNDGSIGTPSQILALESLHVMDGLLTDSLGLTLTLNQIITDNIFQPDELNDGLDAAPATAINWRQRHRDIFDTEDSLATVFFIDNPDKGMIINATGNSSLTASDDGVIVQSLNSEYQFATAHSFGTLLNLREQPGTLQDWQTTGQVSLPAVHWSHLQRQDFESRPPASRLLQVLSNDHSSDPVALPEPTELDPVLIESDAEERDAPIPQNDPTTQAVTSNASVPGGGGSVWWLFIAAIVLFGGLPHRR